VSSHTTTGTHCRRQGDGSGLSMTPPRTLQETVSVAGHRVTLAIEHPGYPGAQPVYVVTRYTKAGEPDQRRWVPVTYGLDAGRPLRAETRHAQARARAESIFEAFALDVTDPKSGVCLA